MVAQIITAQSPQVAHEKCFMQLNLMGPVKCGFCGSWRWATPATRWRSAMIVLTKILWDSAFWTDGARYRPACRCKRSPNCDRWLQPGDHPAEIFGNGQITATSSF